MNCPSGDRHGGGVSPAQARVRNVGTFAVMPREGFKWFPHEKRRTDAP
jgi:hypothetical protein